MKGMYLSFLPLYSIRAHGKFRGVYPFGYPYPWPRYALGYKIYQEMPTAHGRVQYAKSYTIPNDPNTMRNQYWRGWFASGIKSWQGLTNEDKEVYNNYKHPPQCSGFNKFLHYYLKQKHEMSMLKREGTVISKVFDDDTIEFGNPQGHTEFLEDGKIYLHGTARVTRHFLIDPKRFKMPSANFPGESFEGLFYTLDFDKGSEESAYVQEQIPFRWAEGTNITVVVDWLHDSADNGKVVWGIEYKSITSGEVVGGNGVTITKATAGSHTENQLVRTVFTNKILGSNLDYEDNLAIRLFRKVADDNDTLNEDARIINVHFHYTQDKLGRAD